MPPEPQPQDPHEETSKKPATPPGQVDIDKILLPQKEVRKVESDRRVSAGVLLDQELKAGTEGFQKTAPQKLSAPGEMNGSPTPSAETFAPPKRPAEESEVKPLETYQAAIERAMKGGDVSVISIAAAEAQRRAQRGSAAPIAEAPKFDITSFFKKFSMITAGALLLAVAIGVIAYLALRPTTVPVAVAPTAPFISVDETQVVVISPTEPVRDLMQKLNTAKKNVSLSLGLVARLIPSMSSTTAEGQTLTAMSAQTFLSMVSRNIPANLLRTIEPTFLLGVHVYNENQPLLILKVDSYQEAFSGMLEWEFYMKNELAPLFTYTPREHIPEENIQPIATTTATSTATTTASTSPPTQAPIVQVKFIDRIVENHDARVLQNDFGDIYLLWTFLDRNTLVITTNPATLREIITRFQEAPVTAIPGQ